MTARGAALLVTVKANQRALRARLRALPWPDVPAGDRTRHRGHGRRTTRTRWQAGQTTRETAYLIVTVPADHARPEQLNG